jgi:hypothetical protein
VDHSLLGRIQKAKIELVARGKDVVSVMESERASPSALPIQSSANRRSDSSAVRDAVL